MSLRRRFRPVVLAVCVALFAAAAGMPAGAVEAPPGSANFTPPGSVPNYFSNESGPFQGGAAARPAQPGAGPVFTAPAPRRRIAAAPRRDGRHHARYAAPARGRARLARARAGGHRYAVHAPIARSGAASRGRAAHARSGPARSKAVAAGRRPAPGKSRRVARAGG